MLTVATVQWDGSSVLSTLTLDPLAQNAPCVKINNGGSGGGSGTVTQVNGVNPDGLGHVMLTPANIGAQPAASAFSPSAHASTHAGSGSDPVTPASIGALPASELLTSSGGASTIGESASDSQVPSALNVYDFVMAQVVSQSGGLIYKGTWDASTNSPVIASSTGTLGWFYKISVAGSTTVDGNSTWAVGDIIIFDGQHWDRIAGTDSVSSVFGRSGAVAAASGDYDVSQISYSSVPSGSGWTGGLAGALSAIWTAISNYLTSFNGSNKLVMMNASGQYPAADGSQITDLKPDVSAVSYTTVPGGSGWSGGLAGALSAIYTVISGNLVKTFNGRSGTVTPANNDYDVAQIAYAGPPSGSGWVNGLAGALSAIWSAINTLTGGGGLTGPTPCSYAQTGPPSGFINGVRVLIAGAGQNAFAGNSNNIAQCQAVYINDMESGQAGLALGSGSISTAQAHSGTHSLFAPNANAPSLVLTGLAPSTSYAFTCYAYNAGSASYPVLVAGTGAGSNLNLSTAASGTWVQLSGTFTTNSSGGTVTITFTGTASQGAYIDDIVILASGVAAAWAYTVPSAEMVVLVGTGNPRVEYIYDSVATAWVVQYGVGNAGNAGQPVLSDGGNNVANVNLGNLVQAPCTTAAIAVPTSNLTLGQRVLLLGRRRTTTPSPPALRPRAMARGVTGRRG